MEVAAGLYGAWFQTWHFLGLVPGPENAASHVSGLARYTSTSPKQLPRPVAHLFPQTGGLCRKLFNVFPTEKWLKSARGRRPQDCALWVARRGPSGGGCRERRRSPRPKWPGGRTVSPAGSRGRTRSPRLSARRGRSRRHRRPQAGSTPLPNPRAELMTNTGCDGRTHRPALARQCVQGARGSPGPSPVRPAFRLLRTRRSRHLGNSAPATRLGLRLSMH